MRKREAIHVSHRIGTNLKRLRQSKGVEHQRMAALMQISGQRLRVIERGDVDLRASTILRMLDILGADIKNVWPASTESEVMP